MTISASTGQFESPASFRGNTLTLDLSPGFFKGRAFRAYKEFTANTVLKVVATKPFLLTAQTLYVDAGAAKAVVTVGATLGGSYVALPTVFGKNGVVTGAPTPDIVITQNGTATGGTERDVIRVSTVQTISQSGQLASPRYLPAGTYSITITVTGSTSGIYAIEYEELDV